jgi:ketosteroid isomerase-like protein
VKTHVEREALVARISAAFARGDNDGVTGGMLPDVVIVVPGNSPFAGEHRGHEAIGKWLVGLRRAFTLAEKPIEYVHEGDDMIVTNVYLVGAKEWTNRFRVTFDGPYVSRLVWEPIDIDTFDALVDRVFEAAEGPER